MRRPLAMVLLAAAAQGAAAAPADPVERSLDRCLAAPANASTAGQVACATAAARAYDRRMNLAYAALLRRLPPPAAARLRTAQRAWIAFRDAEAGARRGVFATRDGTLFVPMAEDAAAAVTGERARMLERYLRILDIG